VKYAFVIVLLPIVVIGFIARLLWTGIEAGWSGATDYGREMFK